MTLPAETSGRALNHFDPRRANWLWRSLQILLQNVFVFWIEYRARGHDQLPEEGALLLANHESFLDPLLVGLPLHRPVSYLARHSLFSVPLIGSILRRTYVLPINRECGGTVSLREAARRMQRGGYVGIFPEGTRSTNGDLGPIRPGFVTLLRQARIPVVPVGIVGGRQAMPRGTLLLHRARIRVVFGKPLTWDVIGPLTCKGREDELLQLVREQLLACRQEAQNWHSEAQF